MYVFAFYLLLLRLALLLFKLLQIQACLKEIHTKMLHKHLQRLEQRVDGEENLDTVHDLQPEEEESELDVKGMHIFHLWI